MNAAHLHLLLNHIPLISTAVAVLLLAGGILRKSAELKRASLWTFVIAALVTIAVFLTGEPAEGIAEHLPGVADSFIEEHEEAALFSLIAIEALGLASVFGLFAFRRVADLSKVFALAMLGLSIIAGGLMAWTANLGGQIRHTEIRSGVTAGLTSSEAERTREREASEKEEKKGEH